MKPDDMDKAEQVLAAPGGQGAFSKAGPEAPRPHREGSLDSAQWPASCPVTPQPCLYPEVLYEGCPGAALFLAHWLPFFLSLNNHCIWCCRRVLIGCGIAMPWVLEPSPMAWGFREGQGNWSPAWKFQDRRLDTGPAGGCCAPQTLTAMGASPFCFLGAQ